MNNLFEKVLKEVNIGWVMKNTERLAKIEFGQTFDDYQKAAAFTADLIKKAGIKSCEIINFPADGKTVYQDKTMPLAWRATKGKLTILKSSVAFKDAVVADFERHPFHLIKGSVATPQEGLKAGIITEEQLLGGFDAKGCLVMANPNTPPRNSILRTALDLGAIGIITDYLVGRYDTPDGIQWVNACTEGDHWHVQAGDRPFIGFSVSPRTGDKIREAAFAGALSALVECDGKRYEGQLPAVTALIPGRQDRELWFMSHLYEPLCDDNSCGVVSSIEIARIIKKLADSGEIPPLEFSIRLVFAMEMYGFAAFSEKLCEKSGHKVIGAINTDGMAGETLSIFLAPPGTAFFGNYLMEKAVDAYKGKKDPLIIEVMTQGAYHDDQFLSDSTVGIPTLWPIKAGKFWHNSKQTMEILSDRCVANVISLIGSWAASVITLNKANLPAALSEASVHARKHLDDEAGLILKKLTDGEFSNVRDIKKEIQERIMYRLQVETRQLADFEKISRIKAIPDEIKKLSECARKLAEDIASQVFFAKAENAIQKDSRNKWLDYSNSIIPGRATRGFPYDLTKVLKDERVHLPEGVIYGPFARVLANMDGKKTLQRLMKEAEWEFGGMLTNEQLKKYITTVAYLADHGYLKTKFNERYGRAEIIKALKKVGIEKGDLLIVHSALSQFGIIKGGAKTVIDAILECIGERGTVLFPTFTRPYIYFEGFPMRELGYRPYDISDAKAICTGNIPKASLKRKGVLRSVHPSHSFSGIGPLAKKCLSDHKENDPPACKNSPLGKLLELNGKIVHLGSSIASTTFLHFIEDEMDLPYLRNAVCRIKNGEAARTVLIPKHLPGHRDFYSSNAEDCKFFKKVQRDGLEIKEASLGLGKINVMEAKQLYELGCKAIREDPNILLCDSHECMFCSKYRK